MGQNKLRCKCVTVLDESALESKFILCPMHYRNLLELMEEKTR